MIKIVNHILMEKFREIELNPILRIAGIILVILYMSSSFNAELRADEIKKDTTDSETIVEDVKEYSKKDNFFSKLIKSILVFDDDTKTLKSKKTMRNQE